MTTKICPSCQMRRPIELMVQLAHRKIRCNECVDRRNAGRKMVRERLKREMEMGLI